MFLAFFDARRSIIIIMGAMIEATPITLSAEGRRREERPIMVVPIIPIVTGVHIRTTTTIRKGAIIIILQAHGKTGFARGIFAHGNTSTTAHGSAAGSFVTLLCHALDGGGASVGIHHTAGGFGKQTNKGIHQIR